MDTKQVIDLQKWWISEISRITREVIMQEEKRENRRNAKRDAALADFSKESDILDAYGFGCITERQKDRLMDLWQQREAERIPDQMYQAKLDLLTEFFNMARQIILDNGGTP